MSDSEVKGRVGSPVAFRKVPRESLNGAFLSLWVCTHLPQIYSSQLSRKGAKKSETIRNMHREGWWWGKR